MAVGDFLMGMLDTDLYKLSMGQAVLALYDDAVAESEFTDRNPNTVYTEDFVAELKKCIGEMANFKLAEDEYDWVKTNIPYFSPWYCEYLRNYRYDPSEVDVRLIDNRLKIKIKALWHRQIMWEVPLMALVSGLWFQMQGDCNYEGQIDRCLEKIKLLKEAGCQWADFGTRRRRSFHVQDLIVGLMAEHGVERFRGDYAATIAGAGQSLIAKSYFVGTSNVRLAMKYGVKPIGTKAHEWYQAHSQLAGLEHANRAALEAWINVYHSALGIALTDTYGTDAFLRDFSRELAMAYDGVRHDSGDPFKFVDKFVAHYEKLGIDPLSKTAVFSDSLNVEKAIKIHRYCQNKIKDSFGIGTFFTNDFPKSAFKPLNIVIKLVRLNGKPVVKLSDDFGKSFGERDAVRVARYTHMGIPLDMAN